jgi:hypothetical protein
MRTCEAWMKEDPTPVNKTRKVALRKHRAKARKDEAKRKALRMTAHVAARSVAAPAARPARRPAALRRISLNAVKLGA